MGYYTEINDSSLLIQKKNMENVWKQLNAMISPENIRRYGGGCKCECGQKVDSWYSFTSTHLLQYAVKARDLALVFECFGLCLIYAWGDSTYHTQEVFKIKAKSGDEDILYRFLAPYVDDGSFIHTIGEEGEEWRYIFEGGMVGVQHVIRKDLVFDEPTFKPSIVDVSTTH